MTGLTDQMLPQCVVCCDLSCAIWIWALELHAGVGALMMRLQFHFPIKDNELTSLHRARIKLDIFVVAVSLDAFMGSTHMSIA